jgi:hypothetical protein
VGNLVDLQLTANTDAFSTGVALIGQPTPDGGGIGVFRDLASIVKYGVVEDAALSMPAGTFNALRRHAFQMISNRIALSSTGAKTAVVLRDAQTADVWRELDKVMIHDPEIGINYLVARIIGYSFDEGMPTQPIILDQFGEDFIG